MSRLILCLLLASIAAYGQGVKSPGGTTSGTGTDNNVVRWDGTNMLQDSGCSISDAGVLSCGSGTFDLSRWHQCFPIFDAASALTTDVDIPTIWAFEDDYGVQVTRVWCATDGDTATINLLRDDGSAAALLSSDLVCDADGQDSCASGCDVNTIASAEDNFAIGDELDFSMVAIDANVNLVTVCIGGLRETP